MREGREGYHKSFTSMMQHALTMVDAAYKMQARYKWMQDLPCLQRVQGHHLHRLNSLLLASPTGWMLLLTMHNLACSGQNAKMFTSKCILHRRYGRTARTAASTAASCRQCFCSDTSSIGLQHKVVAEHQICFGLQHLQLP